MERLTLPKKMKLTKDRAGEVSKPGIPPGSLPRCAELPLDKKLPMAPGPKNAVLLFTTYIGEKIQDRSLELDFDLTDPYSMLMSNNYKPLHDPHLKPHLTTPKMRRRLRGAGFLTRDGRVLCTLKEFNEYRQYLRKIELALARKREEERERYEGVPIHPRRRAEAVAMAKAREEKLRVVRERLRQQYEEDKARCQQIIREEEARRLRMEVEQKLKQTDIEKKFQTLQERRVNLLARRQFEERRRRLTLMNRWLEEEDRRAQINETRRRHKEDERERKLCERWEERKRVQRGNLDKEKTMRVESEKQMEDRIIARRRAAQLLKERREDMLRRACEERRQERLRVEDDYTRRFNDKMEQMERNRLRRRRMAAKKKKGRHGSRLKSNWNLERTLLSSLSDDEGIRRTRIYLGTGSDEGGATQSDRVASSLGLGDFHGASFHHESLMEDTGEPQKTTSALGLGDFRGASFDQESLTKLHASTTRVEDPGKTANMEALVDLVKQRQEEKIVTHAHLAQSLVSIWLYLSTEVLLPALQRHEMVAEDTTAIKSDQESESKKVRFSVNDEMIASDLVEMTGRGPGEMLGEMEVVPSPGQDKEEDKEEDDLSVSSDMVIKLEGRDSLTRFRRASMPQDDDLDETPADAPTLSHLGQILKKILDDFNAGELSSDQVRKLVLVAKEIMGESVTCVMGETAPSPVRSASSSTSASATDTSLFAETIVQGVFERVQSDLFRQKKEAEEKAYTTKANNLTQYIIEKALALFAGGLLNLTDEVITSSRSTSRKSSAVRMPDESPRESTGSSTSGATDFVQNFLGKILNDVGDVDQTSPRTSHGSDISGASEFIRGIIEKVLRDVKGKGSPKESPRESLGSDKSAVSGATDLVQTVLGKIVTEVEGEKIPQYPPCEKHPLKSVSTTSDFIKDVLGRALDDIATTLVDHAATSETSSLTSMVVGTLEKVVMEMESGRESSETTMFISSLLKQAACEIQRQVRPSSAPTPGHKISDAQLTAASSTSVFIREVLARVVSEIEAGTSEIEPTKSVSSLFAANLIHETLQKCLHDVRSPSFSAENLSQLASAILTSSPSVSRSRSRFSSPAGMVHVTKSLDAGMSDISRSREPSVEPASSTLVDDLIRETLSRVLRQMGEGSMSSECISDIAQKVKSATGSLEISPRSKASSEVAEEVVKDAIARVLGEIVAEDFGPDLYGGPQASDPNNLPIQHMLETFLKHLMSDVEVDEQQQEMEQQDLDQNRQQQHPPPTQSPPQQGQPQQGEQEDEEEEQPGDEDDGPQYQPPSDSEPEEEGEESGSTGDKDLIPHPVVDDQELDVDPEVMNETLLSISAMEPRFAMPHDTSSRNSFCNLSRPDVSNIKNLDTSSKQSVRESLISMSSRTLAMRGSKLLESVPTPTQTPTAKPIPKTVSEFLPRASIKDNIQEQDDEDEDDWGDVESDDSDDLGDRLVSVSNMVEPDPEPDAPRVGKSPELPSTSNAKKHPQSPPGASLRSPKSSNRSFTATSGSNIKIQSQNKSSKTSTRSSALSSSKIASAYGSAKSSKADLSPSTSANDRKNSEYGGQSQTRLSTSTTRRKSSSEGLPEKAASSSRSELRERASTSRSLMLPRKSTDDADVDGGFETIEVTSAGGVVRQDDVGSPSGSTQSLKSPKDDKRPSRPRSKTGRTIELTSSLGSTKQVSPKSSKNECKNKGGSHKSLNMTMRPSSAFGETASASKMGASSSSAGQTRATASKQHSQDSVRRSSLPKLTTSSPTSEQVVRVTSGSGGISGSAGSGPQVRTSGTAVSGSASATHSDTGTRGKTDSLPDIHQR